MNWNERLDLFQDAEFLKWSDFIKSLYRIHIEKCESVTQFELERLESMKLRGICGPNKRFPDGGIYINTSFGFYAAVISDLYDFGPEDPLLKWQLRNALRNALARDEDDCSDAFDRAKFEKKYNLRWTDGIRWKRAIFIIGGIMLLWAIWTQP